MKKSRITGRAIPTAPRDFVPAHARRARAHGRFVLVLSDADASALALLLDHVLRHYATLPVAHVPPDGRRYAATLARLRDALRAFLAQATPPPSPPP